MSGDGRTILWTPVLIALGIGLYFILTFEPTPGSGLAVAAIGLTLFAAGVYVRFPLLRQLLIGLACIAIGFSAAKFRTLSAGTPVLEFSMKETSLTGLILDVETDRRGWRAIIQIDRIGGLPDAKSPRKARLTWPAALNSPKIGAEVQLSARLWPPPKPVTPGGFDFGRKVFFQGIGAFGSVKSIAETRVGQGGWWLWLQDSRRRAASNIAARIGGQEGAVAAALVTGDRTRLSKQTKTELRAAGLSHLLAISGLHMGLAVGVVFFGARAGLALFPGIVLHYPIKKWAAVVAFIAGAGYLAVSGASVSTIRAFIMAAIALGAILVDRQAISLRTVAIAAVVILVTQPEVLVQAGFQMSFAAVVALVAVYERWGRRASRAGWGNRSAVEKAGSYVFGIGLTSLIAGLATAPFAAAHFNRITAYGLLGNLAAMPVMAMLIMPAAVIACFLSPFGISQPAWTLMGWGIGLVLDIAHWIAQLPGADTLIASPPDWTLPVLALGGIALAIHRQIWMRISAGVLVAIGLSGFFFADRPDILAGRWGQTVAIRGADGILHLTGRKPKSYDAKQWLRRDGRRMPIGQSQLNVCRENGECLLPDNQGVLRIAGDGDDIEVLCKTSRIIIASVRTPLACPKALLLDPGDFSRFGNVSIDLRTLDIESVVALRGKRPWASVRYWQ